MPSIRTLFLLVLGVWATSGCSAVVYYPGPHHTPVPKETGEVRAGGYASSIGNFAAQASISPLPHVFTHGMIQTARLDEEIFRMGEAGLGVYHNFSGTTPDDNDVTLSLLGAFGRGTSSGDGGGVLLRQYTVDTRVERIAAQFDMGIWANLSDKIPGDTFITTSMRLSHVRLYDMVVNGSRQMPDQTGIFLEPGAKAGIDFGFVRSYGTFGFTVPMAMFDDTRSAYEPVSLGFGISFDISHPFRD